MQFGRPPSKHIVALQLTGGKLLTRRLGPWCLRASLVPASRTTPCSATGRREARTASTSPSTARAGKAAGMEHYTCYLQVCGLCLHSCAHFPQPVSCSMFAGTVICTSGLQRACLSSRSAVPHSLQPARMPGCCAA